MSSLTETEKKYEELSEELLEEHKKLEQINKRIVKHEVIEMINIIKEGFGMKLMGKKHWKDKKQKQKQKNKKKQIKQKNKKVISRHEIRIESIKDTKREKRKS